MTIKQALHPLLLIGSIFGLGIRSQNKWYLHIFYNILVWTGYCYLAYYTVTTLKAEIFFQDIISMSNLGFGVVTCVASIILSVYNSKRFWTFLERLAAIDYTLAELGTPITHKKLHAHVKGMIIVWFSCSFTANTLDTKWWTSILNSRWYIIVPFVTNHVYHVNMIVDMLFLTLLWYIGTRFDEVNKHMRCLIQEKQILRRTRRKFVPVVRRHVMCADNYKHMLWTSMHLHLELCQVARELNAIFGTQNTLKMMSYLASLSRLLSYEVLHIAILRYGIWTTINWVAVQFWTLYILIKVFYFNNTCETISAKANKIKTIVNHMTNSFLHADVRDEIHQFILQITFHPLKFTGFDFFDFGYSFLQRFITRIVTFIILIVQSEINKS